MDARERALLSLDGLSIGDAFGERFFGPPERARFLIEQRAEPGGVWRYTDDTAMALSIVDQLLETGSIDQDVLASRFAERYRFDPARGYGAGAHQVLSAIDDGTHWRHASASLFGGTGSLGNGAAMRVGPLGAYFAGNLERCIDEARRSAEVTHAHEEGIAGAVAIAVGAALMCEHVGARTPSGRSWLSRVHERVPSGNVRDGIATALSLPDATTTAEAARVLGNGACVTAFDTVPFCLWMASVSSHDYPDAIWRTVSALGDRDTTCAIVGAMVALQVGRDGIPAGWQRARERLVLDGPVE